jgi:hypothetical protein
MALDITRGLFGIEVPESSDQDLKDAVTFAQLSPEQSVRASGMMSGTMLGRGLGNLARAGIGYATGEDVRTPDEKRQAAGRRALQYIQQGGVNPEDPEAYLPLVAKAFQEEGLTEDALKAATALNGLRMAKGKLAVDQTNAAAATANAAAAAIRARTDAAKETREGSVATKIQELAKTGKYTPESLKKYEVSGNINDLIGDNKKVQKVETKDGVYLVPEDTMNDSKTWVRVGDVVRTAGSSQDRETAAQKLQLLMSKHRKTDEFDSDMLARLTEGTPEQRNDAAMMRALAAAAVGTDHAGRVLGEGEKLTEGEQQLFGYAKAADFASNIYTQNWSGKNLPDMSKFKAALQAVSDKDPKAPMTLQFLLTMAPDAETRRYIGDAFGMLLPVLRKDTGAAIAASEWFNYFNTYIPESTDLPESRRDKEKRMGERIIGMRALVSAPKYRMYSKRYDEMMAAQGTPPKVIRPVADIQAEGRAAKAKGEEAYKKWLSELDPEEYNAIRKKPK